MEICLLPSGAVLLEQPDDFRHFAVRVPAGVDASASALAALMAIDGQHAWVPPETVRTLHFDADAAWQQELDAMVAYAASKGWTDAAGRIRAHIQEA